MKNNQYIRQAQYNKGFIVPLLIAVIALLLIGGVYIYKNKKAGAPAVAETGTQQTNTQTPPTSAQTDTSNWKTYTDAKLNITFKYPSDWKIKDEINSDFNEYVLTPSSSEFYTIIYIDKSKVGCRTLLQSHPGKISACSDIGDISIFGRMSNENINLQTNNIINKIISTFKFTK